MAIVKSIVALAHEYLERVVIPGDTVVDATAGNGYDTLKLASLVGAKGLVYAFDIQKVALAQTARCLKAANLEERVKLLAVNHREIANHVPSGIGAAIFNLGYLPAGNHQITTRAEDSLIGVEQSFSLLRSGGIVLIAIYQGHAEGAKERERFTSFLQEASWQRMNILELTIPNRKKAPSLILMENI